MRHLALALACIVPLAPAARADVPATAETAPAAPAGEATAPRIVRGPAVRDPSGQEGHLHRVATGETLWDISEVYLGTPWVWPSLWEDGDESIAPGDVLFVSEVAIRKLTPEQVQALGPRWPGNAAAPESVPAAMAGGMSDALGSVFPTTRFTALESSGFITRRQLDEVAIVIGNPTDREALASGDEIYIDAGGLYVQPGDRLRVVRRQRDVPNPDTGQLIGTFVDPLGWAVVTEVTAESSKAVIRNAVDEIHRGDLLVRADGLADPAEIVVEPTPESITGVIALLPTHRVIAGGRDVVYLDVGSNDGIQRGNAFEVVRRGRRIWDPRLQKEVRVPDTVIAGAVVLDTEPDSSAAILTEARTDIQLGDYVRGAAAP